MSSAKTSEELQQQKHEEGKHHHEAPHPGHSDKETLQKQQTESAKNQNREHTQKVPSKHGDSSDRSFGT